MAKKNTGGIARYFKGVDQSTFAGLIALMILICVLWNTGVVFPLKILVVFFHELSHGIMALLTGGKIVQIQLTFMEGGVCLTEGGNRFWTLFAGYLGSLLWGGLILMTATRGKKQPAVTLWLGIVLVATGLLFIRPLIGFGMLFALLAGAGLIAAGLKLDREWNILILKVIGLTSCMYAVLDIMSDVLARPGAMSDARMLAELTHIPAFLWGLLWFCLGLWAAGYFLITASRRQSS